MVFIPLYIFLIPYLLFLLLFAVFIFINIGHLAATGSLTLTSFVATFATLSLSVLIFYFTWSLLSGVFWGEPVMLWNSQWIGGSFFTIPILN